ncbi:MULTISPECIES: putative nitrogen fixation protein NifT [Mesorhizobium]|uniref:putative nitrogen fixation protein NifT n=1 Tax=Mesorhizobium TaxID=68287 RepID=UPI0007EE025A|nr:MULTISPECIES: putative nitrogen fixation protein NifT [Mesorhizobium]TPJ43715.1 putative nitrogen fixation protein NifT [Mesorhizobium sp. B2-6-6]ARP67342.1 putative nitrogen fixation protein NifT [Mesorhizobium sp. WSM1497]MCA0002929.1 putative nitrogen fixation protein NifT [Mesorhizobium sp. B264B2A]MCA0009215.1 putative nitrogen fixation protein NifT [Mesorhizobium sp. B264B1B]MCA0013984.1 putative nitrogen fixation protein NifT [Mesorhizobium sp. B294B1A1]
MKVMIRRTDAGLSAYVPKKDLEEAIIKFENQDLWGGVVTLRNGWRLLLPDLPPNTRLPITVEARKLSDDD